MCAASVFTPFWSCLRHCIEPIKSLNLSLSLYAVNNWRIYVKFDLACSCVCIQLPYIRRDDMGRTVVQPGSDIGLQIFFIKAIRYEI
jgi:hypothetical protein